MTTYGVTDQGFVLKRLSDIRGDMVTTLSTVQDPTTGEYLTPDLDNENDPLVQIVNSVSDQLAACWEQLQLCYNQFDPLKATGAGLSGLVQLNGIRRNAGEIDTVLRTRQQASTMTTSSSLIESVYSALNNLDGVTYVRVYQNLTSETDERGIPAKNIAVVINGGDDAEIADILWLKASAFPQYGTTSVEVYDAQGMTYSMNFIRPTPVPIYVSVSVKVIDATAWPANGADLIKTAITNYAQSGTAALGVTTNWGRDRIQIGEDIYASDLYIPVGSVPGTQILSVGVGIGEPAELDTLVIDWDEIGTFDTLNITVTVS